MNTRANELNKTDLNSIISNLLSEEKQGVAKRRSMDAEARLDSTLVDVIGEKIQNKGLPLVLRKRLMYEQALLKQIA